MKNPPNAALSAVFMAERHAPSCPCCKTGHGVSFGKIKRRLSPIGARFYGLTSGVLRLMRIFVLPQK